MTGGRPPKPWISTQQAADLLAVTLRTLYRFIDEGRVTVYQIGSVIRLLREDVERFADELRAEED